MSKLLIPAGMFALALLLLFAGLSGSNQEAFLFPNVVAAIMVVIAVLTVVNYFKNNSTEKSKPIPWLVILPALLIFILYLTFAELIGFYVSSFIAFTAIVMIYMPGRFEISRSLKIALVGLLFMAALYSLFTLLLKVQLPRGLFF